MVLSEIKFSSLRPNNPLVIADLACRHEGDKLKFLELTAGAKNTGIDIIKSQIFTVAERCEKINPDWAVFNKCALELDDWKVIFKEVKRQELYFFADIFGYESLKMAVELGVDGIKIRSNDILNFQFVADAARAGKITLIGVGATHRSEIYNLLDFLRSFNLTKKIVLVPGLQTCPTDPQDHSLNEITDLCVKYQNSFGVKVGCADHISGDNKLAKIFPLAALSSGASVIEKHFTLDSSSMREKYEPALGQVVFHEFMQELKQVKQWLVPISEFSKSEEEYRSTTTKTAISNVGLSEGQVISEEMISYKSDITHKLPISGKNFIGKVALQKINKDQYLKRSSFKSNVGAVIIARNSSTRLPGKAMLNVFGRPSLWWVIQRIKECRKVDSIILATSTSKDDDALATLAETCGIEVFRGNLEDVSDRLINCAKKFKLDHIVRVTGDDLIRDDVMIDRIIDLHLDKSADVTISSGMPYGGQTEIFSTEVIQIIQKNVLISKHREYHLEWFLQNSRLFSINYTPCTYEFPTDLRLTLDYKEDLIFFEKLFSHFASKGNKFLVSDVMHWLLKNKDVVQINSHITPRDNLVRNLNNVFGSDTFLPMIKI